METRCSITGSGLTEQQQESLNRLSLFVANLPEDRKRIFESEVLNMNKEGFKTLILRLSEEKHKALKMLAVAMNTTMTDIVNGWIEHAKKTLFQGNIPIRDFTDEEINEMMNNQAQVEKDNPEMMEWARKRATGKKE